MTHTFRLFVILALSAALRLQAVVLPFSFLSAPAGGGGGGTPNILYDSMIATGEGTYGFGSGPGGTEGYGGNYNFVFSANCTVHYIDWEITGTFWTSFSSFKVYIFNQSGNNIVVSPVVAATNARTGSSSWTKQIVRFTFPSPVAITAGTYAVLLGPHTRPVDIDPGYSAGTGASYGITNGANPITGQLADFSTTGTNEHPLTFATYDVKMTIYGTTP